MLFILKNIVIVHLQLVGGKFLGQPFQGNLQTDRPSTFVIREGNCQKLLAFKRYDKGNSDIKVKVANLYQFLRNSSEKQGSYDKGLLFSLTMYLEQSCKGNFFIISYFDSKKQILYSKITTDACSILGLEEFRRTYFCNF